MLRSSCRRFQPPAQIQITPLIDVLLVLLVLGTLMWVKGQSGKTGAASVQAPLLNAMRMTLPARSTSPPLPAAPAEQDARIGLGAHGQLSWQDRPVTLDLLTHQLQEQLARDPGAPVWLAIEASTPYAEVIHWFDWLQARQVTRLNLLTTDPASGLLAPAPARKP